MPSVTKISTATIGPATVADAEELAEFAARSFSEAFSADNDPEDQQAHLDANYGPKQQAAELADPEVRTILARSNDEIVAYAQVRRSTPPPCVVHIDPIELHRFYVDRRAHGTGLASDLLDPVHQAASELGGRHIWLSAWERNPRAIAFYRKAGFVDVGSQIFMVGSDRQVDRVLVVGVHRREAGSD